MKVSELFEGVDKRPQSVVPFGLKVAAEQLRKMGLSVRIAARAVGKAAKSNQATLTVTGDIEEAAILKVLKKNEVTYATVGSTMKGDKKVRTIRIVQPLSEGLKYEDPKGFGRKLFNKVMGIPSGPYKYKVGDTVKYEMSPAQEGGSGTGKITKLLDGHHYLVNGKPVNQNEIKAKLDEAVAEPFKKFKKGQIVKVKKTGEEVEVMSQNDIGLVFTASKDAVKIPNDKKLKVVPGKGYKEYMPRELEEGWKMGTAAAVLSAAVVAGIANSPKVEINGETYDKASSLRSAPADAKTATVTINGKKTKVLYWTAMGTKHNRKNRVYAPAE